MKKAEDCENLSEIRDCIDQIDRNIIGNIYQRATYVTRASEFKNSITDVKASDRVRSMMETRRKWAEEENIAPDLIQSLFEQMISFFIKEETKQFKKNCDYDKFIITEADINDAGQILSLQKRAFLQEAELPGNDLNIKPISQSISELKAEFSKFLILKGCMENKIVGSVRANVTNDICYIGRLIVEPFLQHKGFGSILLDTIESKFPDIKTFELFTGESSKENIRFYNNRGYRIIGQLVSPEKTSLVRMQKIIP